MKPEPNLDSKAGQSTDIDNRNPTDIITYLEARVQFLLNTIKIKDQIIDEYKTLVTKTLHELDPNIGLKQ